MKDIIIKFTREDLTKMFYKMPERFTYCDHDRLYVLNRFETLLDGDRAFRILMFPKMIRNKNVVGYRDTRTNKIYYNSNLELSECKLRELAIHETSHRLGFIHHNKNSWFSRKMQNKLWYDTERKLKSVPYTLGRIAKELCFEEK